MALNLRKITPELHARLKSEAALSGKALEDYCILKLATPLGFGTIGALLANRGEAQKAERRSPKPKAVGSIPTTPAKRLANAKIGLGRVDVGSLGSFAQVYPPFALATGRPPHAATCKCGMCAPSKLAK